MGSFDRGIILAAALLPFLATVVEAEACQVCDDLIEVDSAGAACLVEALNHSTFPADGSPVLIDIAGCLNLATDGERGGVTTMPDYAALLKEGEQVPAAAPAPARKTAYLLDASWARCMQDNLDANPIKAGIIVTLDLLELCP